MSPLTIELVLGLVLFAGAFVQSSVGFGINVIAGPAVVIFAPDLMPGALVLNGFILPTIQLVRDGVDIHWRPLGWTVLARAVTTPMGVWLVLVLNKAWLGFMLGMLILMTAGLSVRRVDVRPTRRNALVAGALCSTRAECVRPCWRSARLPEWCSSCAPYSSKPKSLAAEPRSITRSKSSTPSGRWLTMTTVRPANPRRTSRSTSTAVA